MGHLYIFYSADEAGERALRRSRSNLCSSNCTSVPLQFTAMRCYAPAPMGDLTESDLLVGFGGDGVQGKIEREGKEKERKKRGKKKGRGKGSERENLGQERRRGQMVGKGGGREWERKEKEWKGKGGEFCAVVIFL